VLDEKLLDEATRVFAVRTDSAAVNLALAEAIRVRKIQSLPCFFGSGSWEGVLGAMREDKPRKRGKS
jgi:hypothetical protein